MTRPVVFVGEVNPQGNPALDLEPPGGAGDRLRRILGLSVATYRALTRVNLVGTRDWLLAGATWTRQLSKRADQRAGMLRAKHAGAVVVLLGARVVRHWGGLSPGRWGHITQELWGEPTEVVRLPHPSGRAREWNDPGAARRARALLAGVAPWVPWGEALPEAGRVPLEWPAGVRA